MKFTEGNLRVFLEHLLEYGKLSPYSRESLYRLTDPYGSFSPYIAHPELEKRGFVKKTPDNRNCTVVPGRREFVKVLLAWHESQVFRDPGRNSFLDFVGDFAVTSISSIKKAFAGSREDGSSPFASVAAHVKQSVAADVGLCVRTVSRSRHCIPLLFRICHSGR